MSEENDHLEDVEKDAYHHSLLHFARNYYNEHHAIGSPYAEGAKKQYHFLRGLLTAKLGAPVIDDNMNCIMCGKGIDDGENEKYPEYRKDE